MEEEGSVGAMKRGDLGLGGLRVWVVTVQCARAACTELEVRVVAYKLVKESGTDCAAEGQRQEVHRAEVDAVGSWIVAPVHEGAPVGAAEIECFLEVTEGGQRACACWALWLCGLGTRRRAMTLMPCWVGEVERCYLDDRSEAAKNAGKKMMLRQTKGKRVLVLRKSMSLGVTSIVRPFYCHAAPSWFSCSLPHGYSMV